MPDELTAARFFACLESAQRRDEREKIKRYFKMGEGEYGEGDVFLGVRMGEVFRLAKEFIDMPAGEIEQLLANPVHEARAGALSIMGKQAARKSTPPARRQELYELYLRRIDRINNWDLVDLSCHHVIGGYLADRPRGLLDELARSDSLWERRIAILSTLHFVGAGELDDTFRIAAVLLGDKQDLIHKAVGTMLRECGRHDRGRLLSFLDEYAARMPRTTLRYAMEHLEPELRKHYRALRLPGAALTGHRGYRAPRLPGAARNGKQEGAAAGGCGNAGAMVHLPIYTTCPEGVVHDTPQGFRQRLVNEAKWSEEAGCDGMLIYTDNKSLDPWVVAQVLIEHTKTLVPMVAVNPIEMHPFNVARMISAFGFMHGRRIDLNLVAGGFVDDLQAMGDGLGHAERYDRLAEWGTVLRELLAGAGPVTYAGRYVTVNGLAVKPAPSTALTPHYFVSGTSDACLRLQARWGATRLSYPREISEYKTESELSGCGMRLGIIARDTAEEAWDEARRRFPPDLAGEALHDFAAEKVESRWHRTLSQEAMRSYEPQGCYWIYPFRSYRTLCPYFVGTCQEVGDLLARYIALGLSAILLDEVIGLDDLNRQMEALRYAQDAARRLSGAVRL